MVHRVSVRFASEHFWSHVIGRTDDRVGVAWIVATDGAVDGSTFKSRTMDDLIVFNVVKLEVVSLEKDRKHDSLPLLSWTRYA